MNKRRHIVVSIALSLSIFSGSGCDSPFPTKTEIDSLVGKWENIGHSSTGILLSYIDFGLKTYSMIRVVNTPHDTTIWSQGDTVFYEVGRWKTIEDNKLLFQSKGYRIEDGTRISLSNPPQYPQNFYLWDDTLTLFGRTFSRVKE